MTLLWCVTGATLVVAVAAWSRARRTAKRLEELSQMYWELRCQQGELRMQMQRTTDDAAPLEQMPAAPGQPAGAFVPLTSLKR